MNNNLIRGSLQTIVLKLLNDNGKMYGYEICQKVKEITNDKLVLTEGALYPLLHKLESSEILDVETVAVNNRIRKYYFLSKKGVKETTTLVNDFESYIHTMKLILHGH